MSTLRRSNIACATIITLALATFIKAEFISKEVASKYDISMYYTAATVARGSSAVRLYVPLRTSRSPATDYLAGPPDPNSDWLRIGREAGAPAKGGNFTYPPSAAVLLIPLTFVTVQEAFIIWRVLSLLCIICALYLATGLACPVRSVPLTTFSIIGALSFFPLQEMFYLGQMGAVLLFLWVLGTWLWSKELSVLSSLCFAVGTMLKITPVVVLALFVYRRQWKWVLWFCVWCSLFLGLGIWRLGWLNTENYFLKVLPMMSCGLPGYVNKSLAAVSQNAYLGFVPLDPYQSPTIPSPICWLNKSVSACLFLFILWQVHRRRREPNLRYELAMFAFVALLISPVSWRHHYVMALFPLIVAWSRYHEMSLREFAALVGATVLLGVPFGDYFVVLVRPSVLQVVVAAAPTVAALGFLVIGMSEYSRAGAYNRRADAASLNTA